MCLILSRGFKKKKICCCHYFFPASSQVSHPLLPQIPGRHELRAVAGWVQGKHVLTAMPKLSRSEPGREGRFGRGRGVDGGCRQGCRGAGSEWAGVPREGSPQCTRTIKPNAQLPRPLLRAPGFWARCGVGVSWNGRGRGRSHPRGLRSPLTITSVPLPAPASLPGSLGEPARGLRAREPGGRNSPTRGGGGEGGEWGPKTQTPPPTSAVRLDKHRQARLPVAEVVRSGEIPQGCFRGPKRSCPSARP